MNEEGWYKDPYGRHSARWISDGSPTGLVRDGTVESQDPVPPTPNVCPLERVTERPIDSRNLRRVKGVQNDDKRWPSPWDFGFKLEIGVQEQHEVEFRWAQWRLETRFLVDGVEVFSDRTHIGVSLSKTYEFEVGDIEQHLVTVVRTRHPPESELRKHDFSIFVDGRLVGEF